jgi:hypothetical protein
LCYHLLEIAFSYKKEIAFSPKQENQMTDCYESHMHHLRAKTHIALAWNKLEPVACARYSRMKP